MQSIGKISTFVFLCLFNTICGHLLSITKKCGTDICKKNQYCMKIRTICANCSFICDNTNNSANLDETLCESECQDYLHDKLPYIQDLYDKVEALKTNLKQYEIVSIVCIIGVIILIFVVICQSCPYNIASIKNYINKTRKKKPNAVQEKPTSPNEEPRPITNKSDDLRLEIPPMSTIAASSVNTNSSDVGMSASVNNSPDTAITTVSRRGMPSENYAYDYAYDNPTCQAASKAESAVSNSTGYVDMRERA